MKLDPIKLEHLLQAADHIDNTGMNNGADYYVFVKEKDKGYPFKQIVNTAFTMATGITVDNDFFQSNQFYRSKIAGRFNYRIYNPATEAIPLFTIEDLKFFIEHAGKQYRKGNKKDEEDGLLIKKTIFEKTTLWARLLKIDGFTIETNNSWQRRGIYEKYSWARIFRHADKGKKIFFTVGVDANEQALVYKLDCYYSSAVEENMMTALQHATFQRMVKDTPANWQQVYIEDLPDWDWDCLLETTREFIQQYIPLYDETVSAIWEQPLTTEDPVAPLTQYPIPAGITEIPANAVREFSANGDYEGDHTHKKKMGDAGEELVMDMERTRLNKAGQPGLAAKVRKVLDWNGYDILSYNIDGTQRHIEVKTTIGSAMRPFIWTVNERNFMLHNPETYHLFRLYNYNIENNTADFFVLHEDIPGCILEECIQYKVFIK